MKSLFFSLVSAMVFPCSAATLHSAYSVNAGPIYSKPSEDKPLALMSVFKMHLACAVLHKMQSEGISFDTKLNIKAKVWELDTWSPLRKKYRGKDASISLRELISASVRLSDNITTDILIDYLGGMKKLESRMHAWGISCTLTHNEREMHDEPASCKTNSSTLASLIKLMRLIHEGTLLHEPYQSFLVEEMIACETGKAKIRARLPQSLVIGDKTGSAPRDSSGIKCADNDAGFIRLPDGRVLYMAIFITDTALADDENAALIAHRAQEIYESIEKSPREQEAR